MTRVERAAEAQRLRAEGLNGIQIAKRMGIGRSYAYELLTDPEGLKVRARKDSYRGACMDCGGPTDGSNGPSKKPERCAFCAAHQYDERNARIFRWWENGVHTSLIASREEMTESAVLTLVDHHRHRNGAPLSLRRRRNRELWPLIEKRWAEGATMTELAAECSTTPENIGEMIKVMRGVGVPLERRCPRQDIDAVEVVVKYRAGWSLARIAESVGCSTSPIRRCLREAGVATRPRRGGRAAA